MAEFTLSIVANLRDELQFRRVSGQNFSQPVEVPGRGPVRFFVQAGISDDQPHRLVIVNEDHIELSAANVMDNTSQIFRSLGLLVHFKRMPELADEKLF